MDSQTYRHSFARQLSRQRQDRYSAADRLLGEYFRAALRSSMAFSLSDFKASQNKSKEFLSFFSRTRTPLFSSSSLIDEFFLGIRVSVSSFSSSLTSGKGGSSCLIVSTTFKAIPKPVVCCLSILRLFLKIGDCISSMQWLLVELVDMGTLQTLFVTVQFQCSVLLMTGGAGMRLLMSSATLMPPFWKRVSKMFCSETLLEEAYDLQSSLLMDYPILSVFELLSVFTLPQKAVLEDSLESAIEVSTFFSSSSVAFGRFSSFLTSYFYFQLSFDEKMVQRICFFLNQISLNSLSRSTSPNFISIPSSIDDLLLLNLLFLSSVVSFPNFSSFSVLGSNKVTGTIELALVELST